MRQCIVIVTGLPLSRNPRVVKEATVLANAGYDVEVLTAVFDHKTCERESALASGQKWHPVYVIDNRLETLTARLHWQRRRMRRRFWAAAYQYLGVSNVRQLGYCGPELLKHCLRRKADLYSIHLEESLWVGVQLLKRGFRVGVDFEDWYSEDLPVDQRASRPVNALKRWESDLAQNANYTLTTSHSLAKALAERYDSPLPRVVLNTFPWADRKSLDEKLLDRTTRERLSICWFSQTIGPNRGLETLMAATHSVQSEIEIHLRGICKAEYRAHLMELASPSVRQHIKFHSIVAHDELLSRIAEHDIGFAGEPGYCPNNDLTIANKVFQYFLAGLPVIASSTSGQAEVHQAAPEAMQLFQPGNPVSLGRAIDRWGTPGIRDAAAFSALKAAHCQFNWEDSAQVILESVRDALESKCNSRQSRYAAAIQ